MAQTRLVSAKEILTRVIRATGKKLPSTYHDDVLEWIGEGLGMLQVTNSLQIASTGDIGCPGELWVKNHCVSLPCGFVTMIAVEDENGLRLPEGSDQTDLSSPTTRRHQTIADARASVFEVNPYQHQTSDGLPNDEPASSFPFLGQDINQSSTNKQTKHYYKIVGNKIQTSFEEGFIKVHYWELPVDKEGYPLMPDNENYKQALEWHIIRRLIGAGYNHPVFTYKQADEYFEHYAARGMAEVSFYSPETAARINRSMIRLIPPYSAYEDFFVANEQPERLRL